MHEKAQHEAHIVPTFFIGGEPVNNIVCGIVGTFSMRKKKSSPHGPYWLGTCFLAVVQGIQGS